MNRSERFERVKSYGAAGCGEWVEVESRRPSEALTLYVSSSWGDRLDHTKSSR